MRQAKDLWIPFGWEERRPAFLERFLYIPTFYDRHEGAERVDWEKLFGRRAPVAIEFCSGNGQWICAQARQHPETNWVAVEKRFDRAKKIWARSFREEAPNVYVVCAEALLFLRHYAPPESADTLFIHFPDPWPKPRHARHRIVRQEFLEEMARVAKGGALATVVTDDLTYMGQMVEEADKAALGWEKVLPSPFYETFVPEVAAQMATSFFAELWAQKGRSFYHLPLKRREADGAGH
jgi:tRNA (guanine-N7-)-methyltransferase